MLKIVVPAYHGWDYKNEVFVDTDEVELTLEHSLVSISKWESKWNKSFISDDDKTAEEILDYIRCMTITQNVDPDTYTHLSRENIAQINNYLDAPLSATTISEREGKSKRRERITSEVIYANMVELGIPFECQKWPLQRLMMLIRVLQIRAEPAKKMSKRDIIASNSALNAARRKKLGTKG